MRLIGNLNLAGEKRIALAGMAGFSGGGPAGACCSSCLYVDARSRRHVKGRLTGKCLKYSALMRGVAGPAFPLNTPSCSYFEPGEKR